MADEQGKIYLISRNNYNALGTNINNSSIYLVRENTSKDHAMISMYLGKAKQADVIDITGAEGVSYDDVTQEYDIPDVFQVKEKLLLIKEGSGEDAFFNIFSWDGSKFVKCLGGGGGSGGDSNVELVNGLDSISNPQEEIVYVSYNNSDKGVYVYDGSDFITIAEYVNLNDYVLKSDYNNNIGVDDITIIRTNKLLTGSGANVSGKTIHYKDTDGANKSVTAGTGAHIYNYYELPSTGNLLNNVAGGNYSNAFGQGSRALGDYSFTAGEGVVNKSQNATIFGKYNSLSSSNTKTQDVYPNDYALIIGNGTGNNSNDRSDALSLDWQGNLKLYGNRTSGTGNVEASTGVTLATIRESISSNSTNYVSDYLPANGHEILLSNQNNITDVQINDIGNIASGVAKTDDYSCIFMFVKNSDTTDVNNLMTNFTSTNTGTTLDNEDNPPKIYLLNTDLDISTYTNIHIFVFYDGMKMCAIVGGYTV